MRFEVPQFIEIEDKIFGPFTWKQGVYLGGGVGLAVVLFFVAPFFITFLVGIPVALLAGALAFYPVNSRPFSAFLEAMWSHYKKPREYYWRRNREVIYRGEQVTGITNYTASPGGDSGLNSLARKLELEVLSTTNKTDESS